MEEIEVTGVAGGGDGVGRLADGRAVFVRGAIPGDRVAIEVTEAKPRFARARVLEVLDAGPGRVEAPCPLLPECGGCGWQHVDPATQRELKRQVVADTLTRIGRLTDPPEIGLGPELPATGYRTTVRAGVVDGRAAFHTHHSDDLVAIDPAAGCLVAHPLVDEVLRHGRFPDATEITVRAGVATGERLVVVTPTAAAGGPDRRADDAVGAHVSGGLEAGFARAPRGRDDDDVRAHGVVVPDGVVVVGADELRAGRRVWIHEDVGGRRWRISAGSFFQGRPDGAAALAEIVPTAALAAGNAAAARTPVRVVDLYGGVGLLGGVVADRIGAERTRLQVVEANASSVADARHNLADLPHARVIRSDVRRWHPSHADVVLADPSRHGLGKEVVDRIAATGASTVVLVSCDAGAFGRDAGLLTRTGYRLATATLVDHFPHTPHVEVVTAWQRGEGPRARR